VSEPFPNERQLLNVTTPHHLQGFARPSERSSWPAPWIR